MAMTELSFSVPQRDLDEQEDLLYIRSTEALTASTTARDTVTGASTLRTITAGSIPDQTDSELMQRILEVLLGRYREITRVNTVTVIDSRHLLVTGKWLITGLLKHWISQEFERDADIVVDTSSSFVMIDLVLA